ncbi:methyl-accepting chemotaxis protein [Sporomusa malonica]|uniref:Methyl-accepting chemotaxis protein n=1 Tax=Sporomusa malonica TaxID=112901 RepID=A0A1W1Y911_9FIRM|nr:methyl-accepting chemotaxis protein [Sporomusa malonica]SMC32629.1 methyl-accepting chemotaxis protein [Sporomusa malonica]
MKFGLRGKMIFYFMVVALISAVGFAAMFYNTHQIIGTSKIIAQEDLVRLSKVNEVSMNVLGQTASMGGYLAYGTQNHLENLKKLAVANEKLAEELVVLATSEAGRKELSEIKEINAKVIDIADKKVIPLIVSGKEQEAKLIAVQQMEPLGQALMKKTRDYRDMSEAYTQDELQKNVVAGERAEKIAVIISIVIVILAIGIGIFAAQRIVIPLRKVIAFVGEVADGDLRERKQTKLMNDELGQLAEASVKMGGHLRELVQHFNQMIEKLVTASQQLTEGTEYSAQASGQIAASISSIATGAEKQAKAIDATAAVVEGMSAGLEEIAASANTMAGTAEKTAEAAKLGGTAVKKAVEQMENIEKAVTHSSSVVTKLGVRSQEIGQIVDTISSIAGQTNLLALNAAIEAARAGEQGRGFAVVAEEVRKLAEQSQEASKQIAELISEIQQDTDNAVSAMHEGTMEVSKGAQVVKEAGEEFKEIHSLINTVSSDIREISAAMQQMAGGSQEIVYSIRDIDVVSKEAATHAQTVSVAIEEGAASLEEMAASSEALTSVAEDLKRAVSKFKL